MEVPNVLSWPEIHQLEVTEDYPAAIDALEARLAADPSDTEAVIRLGFNLWYAVIDDDRVGKDLPVMQYANRFVRLFHDYRDRLWDNADFCWAFGLGISLCWYYFDGTTEELGERMLARAGWLDPFWASDFVERGEERFKGRGIFASYYGVEG